MVTVTWAGDCGVSVRLQNGDTIYVTIGGTFQMPSAEAAARGDVVVV